MPTENEIVKLILDMANSSKDAADMADKIRTMGLETKKTHDVYTDFDKELTKFAYAKEHAAAATVKETQETQKSTTAQQVNKKAIDDVTASTHKLETSATAAMGVKAAGGRGLLGFSYAVQDFTSVMTMGGSAIDALPRALMSISNNIDQMGMAAGLSAANAAKLSLAFTGFTLVMPVLITGFKSVWEAIAGGEAAKASEERLAAIRKEAEKLNEEFAKLRDTATETEKTSAEGIKLFLGGRGKAERAAAAIEAKTEPGEAFKALEPEEQQQFGQMAKMAVETDAGIRRRLSAMRTGDEADTPRGQAILERDIAQAQRERDAAKMSMDRLTQEGKRRRAQRIISGAQVAGPAGGRAAAELMGATRGMAGMEGLQEMTPEAIAQQEKQNDEEISRQAEDARGVAETKRRQGERKAVDARMRTRTGDQRKQLEQQRAAGDQAFGEQGYQAQIAGQAAASRRFLGQARQQMGDEQFQETMLGNQRMMAEAGMRAQARLVEGERIRRALERHAATTTETPIPH